MVDSNIKKVTILKKDLPNYIGDNSSLSYEIRYRVVSEDRNRSSHWSPIYKVGETSTYDETGFDIEDIAGTPSSSFIICLTRYGIWFWVGSSSGKYDMKYPSTGPTHMKFRIQKVTQIKQAFDAATYLISTEQAL